MNTTTENTVPAGDSTLEGLQVVSQSFNLLPASIPSEDNDSVCDEDEGEMVECIECKEKIDANDHRSYFILCGWICKCCMETIHDEKCTMCFPRAEEGDDEDDESDEEDSPAEEGECVYCKAESVYECDRCKEADGSDGGAMCRGCAKEHGHDVGDVFLCGGCFEEHGHEYEKADEEEAEARWAEIRKSLESPSSNLKWNGQCWVEKE